MTDQSRRVVDWRPDLLGPELTAPPDILDLIEPHLTGGGDRRALVDGTTALTYAELDLLSAAAARALRRRGIGPGDAVAIRSRLSRWAIIGMLAVLRTGARYAAIDAAFPIDRQRRFRGASAARLEANEPGLSALDPTGASVDLATLVATGLDIDDELMPSPGAQAGAYTQFTSGSTGAPKAVTVSRASLAFSTAARLAYYRAPMHASLLCSSISFDMSVATIYWTLAAGRTLVIPADRPSNIVAIAEAARTSRATHLLMLPSLYELLLAADLRGKLTSLNTVMVAGEVCPPHLVREHFDALPDALLFNEYGPTECTVWSTVHECLPADADRAIVPIGRPIPGARVYVRASGEPQVAADVGELWVGGPGVVETLGEEPGGQPRLATSADGAVYRTGDLVSWTSDRRLEFRGRADNQLKVSGLRIEIGEVEQSILSHPAVRAVGLGVAGRLDPNPFLVAFVVADGPMTVSKLRAHLLERLPPVAVPAAVVSVESLPTQPNDKLDRAALHARAEQVRAERGTARPAGQAVG